MRKIFDIPGGVHPAENKHQSTQVAIGSIPLPNIIVLPLSQHIGAPAVPCVSVGDKVLKGQIVAEPIGLISAPIHASTSGEVIAIEDRFIPHPSGMTAPCVVIKPDGEDTWIELTPCDDYTQFSHLELVTKIRDAGIAGMGGAGFPTAVKLNPRPNTKITTLILNGTECEPYITADDMLMRERADQIIEGAKLLAHLLGQPEEIVVGIEDNKPEAIAAMQKAAEGTNVEIAIFPTKYPSGGEKQLIQILTGKEVPSGGLPADIGIVVQNVGTAVAAYRAVKYGEPLISRVTTVVGESVEEQKNIDVLIGTPVSHILQQHRFHDDDCARLIIGGPMMGFAMEHTEIPVVKTTNCILVPSKTEMPDGEPAQPCIRCGMCAEACPVNLLPQQLYWYSQAEDFDKLQSHNLFDCIECGACSYVCPSNIPLVQYYRASKGAIRLHEEEKRKSDRSRQRFEFRKERIAQAEAEKEAKRIARKKAAEEAKQKLAEQQTTEVDNGSPAPAKTAPDVSPEKQLAKLERALSSAESRVERATTQLNTAKEEGDTDRIAACEARLKQAELKVDEAKAKLAEFQSGASTQTPVNTAIQKAQNKLNQSPLEKQTQTIETLKKRLTTAKEKLAEAEQAEAATVDAFRAGVEKLQSKLTTAEQELAELKQQAPSAASHESQTAEKSAAEIAIEKAKAKAEAIASMSDEEKTRAQYESLKSRLDKAQDKLRKAEEEGSEHIEAFRNGAEKLETKLADIEKKLSEYS